MPRTAREKREERARRLCERLCAEIGVFIPPGIGAWGRAFDMVAEADAAFVEFLGEWEETGDPALLDPIRTAYKRLVREWRAAARAFEEVGGLEAIAAAGQGEQAGPADQERAG